jgi:hypothetical protein
MGMALEALGDIFHDIFWKQRLIRDRNVLPVSQMLGEKCDAGI